MLVLRKVRRCHCFDQELIIVALLKGYMRSHNLATSERAQERLEKRGLHHAVRRFGSVMACEVRCRGWEESR